MEGPERQSEISSLLRALRDHIEAERAGGVRWLPQAQVQPGTVSSRPGGRADEGVEVGARTRSESPRPSANSVDKSNMKATAPSPSAGEAEQADTVEALRSVLGDCQRCKLASERSNIVFGVGAIDADLMFVGEGPGRDEDRQGEPFVGRAGQLLTEIITKGMKLRREDVYIANVIKCRPPGNRNPEPDEIASCIPFLERQIALIRPKVVVALGKFAAQTLTRSSTPITKMRGQWHEYCGVKLMPTLHPAYLLRNPSAKRLVWEDIQQVMAEMGIVA